MNIQKQTKEVIVSYTITLDEHDYRDLETAFDIMHTMHKKSKSDFISIPAEQVAHVRSLLRDMLGIDDKKDTGYERVDKPVRYDVYASIKSEETYDVFKDIIKGMFPDHRMPMSMSIPCDIWVGSFTKPEYQDLLKATPSCIELKVLPQLREQNETIQNDSNTKYTSNHMEHQSYYWMVLLISRPSKNVKSYHNYIQVGKDISLYPFKSLSKWQN